MSLASAVTVISAVPAPFRVTFPFSSTVATLSFDVAYFNAVLAFAPRLKLVAPIVTVYASFAISIV